jgi:hypothetical protein
MIVSRVARLFLEEDLSNYKAMQEFRRILCNYPTLQDFTDGEPMFRMKFPVTIT